MTFMWALSLLQMLENLMLGTNGHLHRADVVPSGLSGGRIRDRWDHAPKPSAPGAVRDPAPAAAVVADPGPGAGAAARPGFSARLPGRVSRNMRRLSGSSTLPPPVAIRMPSRLGDLVKHGAFASTKIRPHPSIIEDGTNLDPAAPLDFAVQVEKFQAQPPGQKSNPRSSCPTPLDQSGRYGSSARTTRETITTGPARMLPRPMISEPLEGVEGFEHRVLPGGSGWPGRSAMMSRPVFVEPGANE